MRSSKKKLGARAPLNEKTIVIAGASSGIGRAAALAFAGHGCSLILLARRSQVLAELAAECLEAGARQALAVQADVTKPETLDNAVRIALESTGKIDIWINNAGSGAVGTFEEIPLHVHHKVIETNLNGYINGTYSVLPLFKQQGYGTLINTISVGAFAPEPYVVAYSASKYGLRAFLKRSDVNCCTGPTSTCATFFRRTSTHRASSMRPTIPARGLNLSRRFSVRNG